MYKIEGNKITLVRGDSFYATISLKQGAATYTPQEGDVIWFGMKKSIADTECVLKKQIPNDTLLLYIEPADTKTLACGGYIYDLEITFANGDVDTFINNEPFTLATEVV